MPRRHAPAVFDVYLQVCRDAGARPFVNGSEMRRNGNAGQTGRSLASHRHSSHARLSLHSVSSHRHSIRITDNISTPCKNHFRIGVAKRVPPPVAAKYSLIFSLSRTRPRQTTGDETDGPFPASALSRLTFYSGRNELPRQEKRP